MHHARLLFARLLPRALLSLPAFLFPLLLLAGLQAQAAEGEFLPPEEAFPLSGMAVDGGALRLNFAIPDGYYLYRDKFRFVSETPGVVLGEAVIPEGVAKQDEYFGEVHTLHGPVELLLPIQNPNRAPQMRLRVTSQGCADAGLCYPPLHRTLEITLPAAGQTAAAVTATAAPLATPATPTATAAASSKPAPKPAPAAEAPVSEQDRLAALLEGGNLPLIVAAFFGVGLLLAFTPCVFPMIPILSGIIAGQGAGLTTRKAFTLSLVYVLAMALTYTAAGVLAGMFGSNLQAAFQNPWILSFFILTFILLSLSMFGFYELQIPSAWQSRLADISNRQEGGTLFGVAIMGLLSALIVGPCVAPPLVAALIYIGKTGDAVLGGLSLFALSLGMGAPLLAIGTSAGKVLPRAGAWMNAIKAVFGIGLLAVAIVLLERIVPPAFAMVAWGVLMITSAVYMGATRATPAGASGWSRLWQGIGLVLLIYGALMLLGAAAGGRDTVQPLRGIGLGGGTGEAAPSVQFRRIKTVADLEREVAAAAGRGQGVMLDFYADWCTSCKEMERYTFSDPAVARTLANVVTLQADVTDNDAEDQALMQGRFGIPGPPAILFFGPDGQERAAYRVVGVMEAAAFAAHAQKALR